ncbi:MAG: MFS transporter [Pseudomonadota bacterium]
MLEKALYETLTQEGADPAEASNFTTHLLSLTATKLADGLIDPKLVLSWLLSALGAPGAVIGALVPVREAGALLPQIALARVIQARRYRRAVWAAGSALQGLAALGMGLAAFLLEGAVAGWVILGCLALLACARAACSASYKDIAARTLEKGTRGTVSGTAGTAAAAVVFAFAAALATGLLPLSPATIAAALVIAGGLWLIGAGVFLRLDEPAAEPDAAGLNTEDLARPLAEDPEFRAYLATRGLLIATALAPPFIVLLSAGEIGASGETGTELGNLGVLMIASALAAIASSYVWGRLSDASSRRTLAWSGALAAVALGVAALLGWGAQSVNAHLLAAVLFVAQIAYEGVRAGRKTHLTDMDTGNDKALYTALSNTLIGVLLLAGGLFGLLADAAGPGVVLAIFAAMAVLAAGVGLSLSEVQEEEG